MHKKSKIKAIVAITVALVFLAPTSAVFANELAGESVMSIYPATQTVNKGEAFTFSVYVEPGVVPVKGMAFRTLSFDPTLIQIDGIVEGDIADLDPFDPGDFTTTPGEINDAYGFVKTGTVTTPGSFIVVSCHALQELGTSTLILVDGDTSDVDNVHIPTIVNNGEVVVEPIYYTLDITIDPSAGGTVTQVPGPDILPNLYAEGTSVVLDAVPASGDWLFKEWTGDLTGSTDPETIVMDGDKAITAIFTGLGWASLMTFTGDVTALELDDVVFGEDVGATDGIDIGIDLPKPDAPPAPFIYTYLATNLPDPYDILWKEFRFYNVDNDLQIFDLFVETDTAGGPETVLVTIVWDNVVLATETQYDYIGLYDVLSGDLLANMKAVGTYVFTADSGMANHFQIICTDNHAPVAYDDYYDTMEAHELNVLAPGVLANDFDEDGNDLTAVLVGDASQGTLTLNADGSFDYIPNLLFYGTDAFTYKANDGTLDSNIATVTIEVKKLSHIGLQDGWNIISMPVGEPIEKTDILVRYLGVDYTWADASGTIILGFTFVWESGVYTDVSDLIPGEGYWMWSYEDCELLIPSNVEADNHITNLDVEWNLVGIPYGTFLEKTGINVYYNGDLYTWEAAANAGIILELLYDWDRANQKYALTNIFDPGFGYWMYAYHGCALKKA